MRGFLLFAPSLAFVACSTFGAGDPTTPTDGGATESGASPDGAALPDGGGSGCLGSSSFLCDDFDDDMPLGMRWSNMQAAAPAEIRRTGALFASPSRSVVCSHPDLPSGPNLEAALRKAFPAARSIHCTFRFFVTRLTATDYDIPITIFANQGATESVNVDWFLGEVSTFGVHAEFPGGPEDYYPTFAKPPEGKWLSVGLDVDYAQRRASMSYDGATTIVRSWNRQVTPDTEELRLGLLTGAGTTAAEFYFDDVKCDFQP
jgi:hypothetical protein